MRNRYQLSTFDEDGNPEYGYLVDLGDELELSCTGRSRIILKREPPHETYTAQAALRTIIPLVDYADTSLIDMADFLRLRSREIRPPGLDIVVIPPAIGERRIPELKLRDVSVATVMKYVAELASTVVSFEDDAIVLRAVKEGGEHGDGNSGHASQ